MIIASIDGKGAPSFESRNKLTPSKAGGPQGIRHLDETYGSRYVWYGAFHSSQQ
ncbi:hypothetical protein D1872_297930 [compost metagenome]